MNVRVSGPEIGEDGPEGDGIPDFLILVGTIGLGRGNLWVAFSEIIVEEGDVTADAQAVGDDTGLDGIAEMTVDVLLAGVGIGLGGIRQEGINSLVRIEIRPGLCELPGFPELGIEEFGIVLGDGEFDTGGIIDEVIGLFRINLTADGFGQLYKILKHLGEERAILVSEACKLGSVRNLIEAAEIPKLCA